VNTTELRQSRAVPAVLVGGGLALGGLLGWFGPALAGWVADLLEQTPIPVHGLIQLLADVDHDWSLPILGGLGILGSIAIAVIAHHEAPELDVNDDHLEHRQEHREVWIDRGDVGVVFRDGRDLVLLTTDGGLRARLDVDDLSASSLLGALRDHGWPVKEQDPYEADFEAWADGRPGFSTEQNALLRRRREARKDPTELRTVDEQLTEMGLVVRVRTDRLQVRPTRRN